MSGNKRYANEILDDIECYKAVLDGRLKQFPRGFWTKPWSLQSASVITRYLLEERLKYTEEDIKTKVGIKTFIDNKLTTLLGIFNNSPYSVLDNAYPGRFKPWELNYVPNGFWEDKNNVIWVVKWVVETKLDNNRDRVCKEFTSELLNKYKVKTVTKYGIYNILNMAYPNEFKPWELNAVPNGFWDNEDNIKDAVRWVVKTKLGNDKERVKKEFNTDLLLKYGMNSFAKCGIQRLINLAYPNEFKPWELAVSPKRFWDNQNNIKEAVRWVVETKLDNDKERVKKEFTGKLLQENGLETLRYLGMYNLINMVYPNEFKPSDFNRFRLK